MTEIRSLLEKAERAFRAAEGLLREGDSDFAASRAYYAYFYVAQALLLTQGARFSSHGQVVAQFGLLFAKTQILDPQFHRLLLRAFKLREIADYQVEVAIEAEVVTELIQEGRRFLEAASDHIAHSPGDLK